ncbi:MAG: hypothetical protein ABIZ81_00255 [Opitutaceae bacterium]
MHLLHKLQWVRNNQPAAFHPVQKNPHDAEVIVDRLGAESASFPPRNEAILGDVAQCQPTAPLAEFQQSLLVLHNRVPAASRVPRVVGESIEMFGQRCLGGIALDPWGADTRGFPFQIHDQLSELLLCHPLVPDVEGKLARLEPAGEPHACRPQR